MKMKKKCFDKYGLTKSGLVITLLVTVVLALLLDKAATSAFEFDSSTVAVRLAVGVIVIFIVTIVIHIGCSLYAKNLILRRKMAFYKPRAKLMRKLKHIDGQLNAITDKIKNLIERKEN